MSATEYSVIGTRPIRHDGADKVTGRALYGGDFQIAGLLYGHVLRSPHAHARIVRIDTRKAEALPGVRAVATAADFLPAETASSTSAKVKLHSAISAATSSPAARSSTRDTPSPPSPL